MLRLTGDNVSRAAMEIGLHSQGGASAVRRAPGWRIELL
jgi:hypothetical protein